MKFRKRVLVAPLTVALSLIGCVVDPDEDWQRQGYDKKVRNAYKSKSDCLKDNPSSPCEYRRGSDGMFYYVGAWYLLNRGSALSPRAVGVSNHKGVVSSVSKVNKSMRSAGFGSTARSISARSYGG